MAGFVQHDLFIVTPINMTEYPVWKNPPILEAVLDIRVTLPDTVDLAQLATFQQGVLDRFPTQEPQTTVQFGFEAQAGQAPSVQASVGDTVGYRLASADGQRVIQVQHSGFTYSRVGNYETWDNFAQEARELWQHYLEVASPETVIRLGLRYINQIFLPTNEEGPVDLKEYILTAPEIAPGVPQILQGFFMRLVISSDDQTSSANIIQVLEPYAVGEDAAPLILDIDVFKPQQFEPWSAAIWDAFASLREFKNQIFYNSITEKTKGIFR